MKHLLPDRRCDSSPVSQILIVVDFVDERTTLGSVFEDLHRSFLDLNRSVLVCPDGPYGIRVKDEKFSVNDDGSAVTSDGKGGVKGEITGGTGGTIERRHAKLQRMLILSHPCRTKYDT